MNARPAVTAVRLRMTSSVAALIGSVGIATIAAELGVAESTVRKKRTGEWPWHDDELIGLMTYERDERGSYDVLDTLNATVREREGGGDQRLVRADIAAELKSMGALIARAAAALADGVITPREAGELRDLIREKRRAEAKLLRDLDAFIAHAQRVTT